LLVDPERHDANDDCNTIQYVLVSINNLKGCMSFDEHAHGVPFENYPSPIFFIDSKSTKNNIIFIESKITKENQNGWMQFRKHTDKCRTTKNIGFCHPVIWFALKYGASPLKPKADPSYLRHYDGEQWQMENLELGGKIAAISARCANYSNTNECKEKILAINWVDEERSMKK